MVLINNMIGSALETHNFPGDGKQQQHFKGIMVPIASPSQYSSIGVVENSSIEHQSSTSSLLTSWLETHAYDCW